jgi:hypothetical protein
VRVLTVDGRPVSVEGRKVRVVVWWWETARDDLRLNVAPAINWGKLGGGGLHFVLAGRRALV